MEDIYTLTSGPLADSLDGVVPARALALAKDNNQKAIPALAKDPEMVRQVEGAVRSLQTQHQLILGDSRQMDQIPDGSVHLVVTSPPYWTLKEYPKRQGQLGQVEDYEAFLASLDQIWSHVFRVLVPGGS